MQILHCNLCGAKLPQNASTNGGTGICDKCAAARKALPAATRQAPPAAPVQTKPAGSMGFYFCEKCGKRVTNADLAAGQGRDKQMKGVYCAACSDGTMTVAFDAISQEEIWKEEQKRRQGKRNATSRRLKVSPTAARRQVKEAPRTRTAAMAVPVIAIVVLGVAVGAFFILRNGSAPGPKAAAATSDAEQSAQEKGDAAGQLAKIKAMRTADLSTYSEMRKALTAFQTNFGGEPELSEAAVLLSAIDAEYAKRAEDALASAVKAASTEADLDTAVAQIKSVAERFRAGPWHAQTGQAKIDAAIAQIKKGRAGSASGAPNTGTAASSDEHASATPVVVAPPPAPDLPPGVYEPFDYQDSASTKGFDGPWQLGMSVAEDSMPWGPLPVKGSRGKCAHAGRRWHTSAYRMIAQHALKDAGLLSDGATLWLSAVVPLGDCWLALGSKPFYYPRDADFFSNRMHLREGGQGIGFSNYRREIQSAVWVNGRRRVGNVVKPVSKDDARSGTALFVLKVTWGSDGHPDQVQLFMPNRKLQLGKVVSEISADIDQSSLNCIGYSAPVGTPVDEIRIEASYADVIGNVDVELEVAEVGNEAVEDSMVKESVADSKVKSASGAKASEDTIPVEYDRLMSARQYEAARKHLESKMSADGSDGKKRRAAVRIARILAEMPEHAVRGAKTLVGKEQPLKLAKQTLPVTIRGVSSRGLDAVCTLKNNNQTVTHRAILQWRQLHPSQLVKFAQLSGLKLSEAEAYIIVAYLSFAAGDKSGARAAVEKATDHPLKAHVSAAIGK